MGLYAADHAGLIGVAIAGCAFTVCAIVAARLARNTADDHTKIQPARSPADAGPGASTESSSRAAITTVPLVSFAGHLVAVSLYAAILSSVGTTSRPSEVWLPVVAALLIQVCLAPGRLAGGRLADSCPPLIIFGAAATLSVLGTISFFATSSMLGMFLAVALIGFTSGVGQTAALTALMRRAHTSRSTEMLSAGWNIAFDGGLGIGSYFATLVKP